MSANTMECPRKVHHQVHGLFLLVLDHGLSVDHLLIGSRAGRPRLSLLLEVSLEGMAILVDVRALYGRRQTGDPMGTLK